jgi:hypothetical protein
VFYNTGLTDFVSAEYQGGTVVLNDSGLGKIGVTNFATDNTLLSFPTFDHRVADGIDENANSDEYSVFST